MGLYIKGLVLTDEIKGMLQQLNAMDMVVEVKAPHGRLVDIKDINELMNRYKYDDFDHIDYHTPTVIEAEE